MTRVLLVEDGDGDARLIEIALASPGTDEIMDGGATLERTETLAEALEWLSGQQFDVVLLDLNLPDATGLDTLHRLRAGAPDVPVVVLSGLSDAELGARAVREGAQDYLVKGRVDGALLARSLRYAIERRRAEREERARAAAEAQVESLRREEERRRAELHAVERLASPNERTAQATARSFGVGSLSEAAPERFEALVERYAALLDRALEERAYRVEHRLSDGLRGLAEELGFLRAGPRDVIELHTCALHRRIKEAPHQRAQAYLEEARMVVLELMGHLVAYYRI